MATYFTVRKALCRTQNWIDTCDVRIQLYWECTNSTLPSIALESI